MPGTNVVQRTSGRLFNAGTDSVRQIGSFRVCKITQIEGGLAKLRCGGSESEAPICDLMAIENAAVHFTELIRKNLRDISNYLMRSVVRTFLGDLAGAKSDCDAAVRMDSKDWCGRLIRGQVLLSLDRGTEAIADLNEALRLEPGNISTLITRAEAFALEERSDLALADLNEATRLSPARVAPLIARAGFFTSKGDPDKAIADFQRAISLEPTNSEVALRACRLAFFPWRISSSLRGCQRSLATRPNP